MIPERKYASGTALRTALEERLKRVSREEGIDLQRLRRQVAFDRFLARLFRAPNNNWVLKGGYAMELRFQTARTTKDLDFTVRVAPAGRDDSTVIAMSYPTFEFAELKRMIDHAYESPENLNLPIGWVVMADFAIMRGEVTEEAVFPALRRFLTELSVRKDGVNAPGTSPIPILMDLWKKPPAK